MKTKTDDQKLPLVIRRILSDELDCAILPDTKTHVNRFLVRSEKSDRTYVVSQRRGKRKWLCGCFDFLVNRKQKSNCKHLRPMVKTLRALQKEVKALPPKEK
jgi:hypothetical protein